MKKYIFTMSMLTITILSNKSFANTEENCYKIGEKMAIEQSGKLLSATYSSRDNSCIIVVIVPARDGERPRRVELSIPLK